MKILILADHADKRLWDRPEKIKEINPDLVLSAGDLPAEYLSFITCFTKAPVLYVSGNHDERYEKKPPEGCINIDGKLYVHNGVKILGLGGSMRYKPGGCQYTQREQRKRAQNLKMRLNIKLKGGLDIILAHSPAFDENKEFDLCHTGFIVFNKLMDKYKPRYLVHGHWHPNYQGGSFKRTVRYNQTDMVNAYESYVIEL